jgi:transposase InsO family protein
MAIVKRAYDTRVREIIARTGNANLFPELDISRGTRATWVRRGPRDIVGLDEELDEQATLLDRLAKLERGVRVLTALLRLVITMLRLSGFRVHMPRIPEGRDKQALLFAVARARAVLPLASVLKVLHLSPSRYHAWLRAEQECELDDRSSCPQAMPQRLTGGEVLSIKSLVLSTAHRHMSIRALALHAQRVGDVLAHPVTWYKLIRERGWIRPRTREYPQKPKIGVRTVWPNEAWHVDTTIIKLLDGTKAYLHAVIDNYSRKILAWTVSDTMNPSSTYRVLVDAAKQLPSVTTNVIMDSGSENLNRIVDPLFDGEKMRRILALVDVSYSNSMIAVWWRSLRHQWLYLHHLDALATVRRPTAFYVQEHNTVMPHSAFEGQTPDEMYFGRGARVPEELALRRLDARRRRLEENKRRQCAACPRAGLDDKGEIAA